MGALLESRSRTTNGADGTSGGLMRFNGAVRAVLKGGRGRAGGSENGDPPPCGWPQMTCNAMKTMCNQFDTFVVLRTIERYNTIPYYTTLLYYATLFNITLSEGEAVKS